MDSPTTPTMGKPSESSPLSQRTDPPAVGEGLEVVPSTPTATGEGEQRTTSTSSTKVDNSTAVPSRSGTLKRNASLRKRTSLTRRSSKRSLRAGSMKGLGDEDDDGFNNAFHTPIPTTGNPTEILATRFQAWRKLLKDLITYFREIQTSYESRSKALLKVSNVINNTHTPSLFMSQGGLDEAINTLRGFHKVSLTEANKAKDIEDDVITQLNGLRNDLNQKIKEIKSLSGDFKNSVDREKDNTRKAVAALQDALSAAESDPASASGKSDPYIMRLSVDRQVEKQIEEENYLHRAYLNLEGSGRELESIVVGEIQKAYNAYVGILRRETDHAHETIDNLRAGPIAIQKDHEWANFVEHDPHFVNPNVPLRRLEDIYYPDKFNPAALDIRSGMLERKSKYLKSYTPGWYVLSPTHLHEFKSGDHLHTQTPVMSLYLLDQKLGSHSQPDASSHKFSFKGRQTGAMHRGHSWVFRAESHDTMMAWYEAIKILTEKTSAERNAFVRQHARSISAGSFKAPSAVSSDGVEEDEADEQPFSGNIPSQDGTLTPVKRPEPGGRFPSDLSVNRGLQAPQSPSSNGSPENKSSVAPATSPPQPQPSTANQQIENVETRDYSPQIIAAAPITLAAEQHRPEQTQPQQVENQSNFVPATVTTSSQEHPTNSTYQSAGPLEQGINETNPPSHPQPTPMLEKTQPSMLVGGVLLDPSNKDSLSQDKGMVQEAAISETPKEITKADPTPLSRNLSETAASGITSESSLSLSSSPPPSTAPTGHILPAVLRHETTKSASELHVPGEFPPPTPASED